MMNRGFLTVFFVCFSFIPFLKSQSFEIFKICENDGIVSLGWETFNDTCSGFNFYTLHLQKTPNSNFKVVDTFDSPSQNKVNYAPNNLNNIRQWKYFVKIHRDCFNDSFPFSDTGEMDKTKPDPLEFDSISVRNGNAVLGWSPKSSKDVQGYNIYYVNDQGQTLKVDTVFGAENTFYIDSSVGNPENGFEKYRIGAFDSCFNASPISIGTHRTIFLEKNEDSCRGTIELKWEDYKGWDVDKFGIYVEKAGGDPQKIKEVDGDTFRTVLTSLGKSNTFKGFVRAFDESGERTSSSNIVNFKSFGVSEPGYTYIREVSVKDSNNHLVWFIENAVPLEGFEIYRGETLTGMDLFKEVNYEGGKKFEFVDSQAEVLDKSYFYQVKAKGICGNVVDESNWVKSIFLEVRKKNDFRDLRWNSYQGFDGGLAKYDIQRLERGKNGNSWVAFAQSPRDLLDVEDTKTYDSFPARGVCYRIKAYENNENQYGFKGISFSNVNCVFGKPIVYVPNAFFPAGKNKAFRPKGLYIDHQKSNMTIFNRWGQKIFETSNLEEGWSGRTESGDLAPSGVYFYRIKIVGKNNFTEIKKGDVTLLR